MMTRHDAADSRMRRSPRAIGRPSVEGAAQRSGGSTLCHSVGPPQVQADGAPDQGSAGLVRPVAPGDTEAGWSLAFMPWRRPNIGSRVTREGHARLWERPGVKTLSGDSSTASILPCAGHFWSNLDSRHVDEHWIS